MGRRPRRAVAAGTMLLLGLAGCASPQPAIPARSHPLVAKPGPATFAQLAAGAAATLEQRFYAGAGTWNACVPHVCSIGNHDWGDDSLTYDLYLDWLIRRDQRAVAIMRALAGSALLYGPATSSWSDVPMWDSVAAVREYQVTREPAALRKAEAAFDFVDSYHRRAFARGACPSIDYQSAGGGSDDLKTLETDSNYVKAAVLLYEVTRSPPYLRKAESKYEAIRQWFFEPATSLYTVYVFDDGTRCTSVPGRYFASVNGNMIWAGETLARLTGDSAYRAQAVATAAAVGARLSDAAGIYADLQAENDVGEPLVEAMYDLATLDHESFASAWLATNAAAAASDRRPDGTYGRFFGGPPPQRTVTSWQSNGGLALQLAAGGVDPRGPAGPGNFWAGATFVREDLRLGDAPVSFTFSGDAVAIIGTIGEICCQPGHAQVLVDGARTFDQTGIWQNKSSSSKSLPGSVLFAWRWPSAGHHLVEILPAAENAKEGGTFFHMVGYYVAG